MQGYSKMVFRLWCKLYGNLTQFVCKFSMNQYKKYDVPSCLGRRERWQTPATWPRAHMASSKVESSSTILRAFWFFSYFTCRPTAFSQQVIRRKIAFTHTFAPTSTIWAPGLMPTVWAALPSVTWCTNTPVLLPPTTASWLRSASPWKEMLRTLPLTRIAFGRERIRKGGTEDLDRLTMKN